MNLMENYKQFLDMLSQDLDAMFEHQKDYIFCKEGCSHCCENGEYPFTEIEFDYLLEGYKSLDEETRKIVDENIKNITPDENGYYVCPFLINKKCSVYEYRAIVCRTFGLINTENGKVSGPFCGKLGLNYSNVFDPVTKELRFDIIEEKGYTSIPRVFNLEISNIRTLPQVKELGIEFSAQRPLREWIAEKM